MLDVNFDRLLSVLHGWLGEEINVGVEVTAQPLEVARMKGASGRRRTSPTRTTMSSSSSWVGAPGSQSIGTTSRGRTSFLTLTGLIVSLYDDPRESEPLVAVVVHVVGRPLA
jgi:hypothetical protein